MHLQQVCCLPVYVLYVFAVVSKLSLLELVGKMFFQVTLKYLCLEMCTKGHVLSLTIYPRAPITTKPTPTACDILMNSRLSAGSWRVLSICPSQGVYAEFERRGPDAPKSQHLRFVHLFKNCVPSLRKSFGISAISLN